MFEVQYRCIHRDYWYEDLDTDDWNEAVRRARQVAVERRGAPVRVVLTKQVLPYRAGQAMMFIDGGQERVVQRA